MINLLHHKQGKETQEDKVVKIEDGKRCNIPVLQRYFMPI